MDIFKVIGFTILSLILIIVVRENRKDIAIILSLVSGIFIIMFAVNKLDEIVNLLNSLAEKSGLNKEFFIVILKVTAIAYMIEIAKSMCIDSKESALAEKIEIAGKVIIISISIPVITSLLSLLSDMMVLL